MFAFWGVYPKAYAIEARYGWFESRISKLLSMYLLDRMNGI